MINYKKEIRVKIKHNLNFKDEDLTRLYTKLKSYSDETTLKSELIFMFQEEKAFILNKSFLEFRFTTTFDSQEHFINEVINIIKPDLVIDEIICEYLEEKPLQSKNFNKVFVDIPENIEVELLGFKLVEDNKTFYISLINKNEKENTRKLVIKTNIKGVTTSNITNELLIISNFIQNNVRKSIDKFIKE